MPDYRVLFTDDNGQISVSPEVIDCCDDGQAKKKAKELVEGQDAELWDGGRLVELFARK